MDFHILLMVNQAVFQRKFFAKIAETGLTSGQPKVLDYLKDHDGSVQKDIASACQIDPATVTSLLLRMEEAGLVQRRNQPGNRRSLHVFLTDKGKREIVKIQKAFLELEEEVFKGFSAEERTGFMEMFMKINKNISDEK